MSEQLSATSGQRVAPAPPPVKVWTSRAVAYTTLFLGFPGGLVMAALNWRRMGLADKAITHLVGGAAASLVFIVLVLLLPGNVGRVFGVLVNLGVLIYLEKQTKKDIEAFKATNREVQYAHWLGACVIGLVMLGLFFVLAFAVGLLLMLVGVYSPE